MHVAVSLTQPTTGKQSLVLHTCDRIFLGQILDLPDPCFAGVYHSLSLTLTQKVSLFPSKSVSEEIARTSQKLNINLFASMEILSLWLDSMAWTIPRTCSTLRA